MAVMGVPSRDSCVGVTDRSLRLEADRSIDDTEAANDARPLLRPLFRSLLRPSFSVPYRALFLCGGRLLRTGNVGTGGDDVATLASRSWRAACFSKDTTSPASSYRSCCPLAGEDGGSRFCEGKARSGMLDAGITKGASIASDVDSTIPRLAATATGHFPAGLVSGMASVSLRLLLKINAGLP